LVLRWRTPLTTNGTPIKSNEKILEGSGTAAAFVNVAGLGTGPKFIPTTLSVPFQNRVSASKVDILVKIDLGNFI
jgi:hypothetical protein